MRNLEKVLESIPGCELGRKFNRHGRPVYFHGRRVGLIARKESDPRSLRNVVLSLRREGVPVRLRGSRPVVDEAMLAPGRSDTDRCT
jgi:hypothetical protein